VHYRNNDALGHTIALKIAHHGSVIFKILYMTGALLKQLHRCGQFLPNNGARGKVFEKNTLVRYVNNDAPVQTNYLAHRKRVKLKKIPWPYS
jgi:hypothetical protein